MTPEFSDTQKRLFTILALTPDTDIPIVKLYDHLYDHHSGMSVRDMQQKLSPTISKINEKLNGRKIEPGQLKQTYRLNSTPASLV